MNRQGRAVTVNRKNDRNEREAEKAAPELARLQKQIEQLRARQPLSQSDVDELENLLINDPPPDLQEANEQLVFAMLRAQVKAEGAAQDLKKALQSAETDTLTELPNRVLFFDRFTRAIANAKRRHDRLALLFLDLNNFKQINDTLGHTVGDQALKLAADCFVASVREADTVSRHGGDEFLILLTEISQASDAALIANKVIAALGVPNRVGDHVLRLSTSIGISIYPDDGDNADTLIERADSAMYRAKKQGLGGIVFHGETPRNEASQEPQTFTSLKRLVVHYELAMAERERQHEQLREANEQLLLAALSAQKLQAAAEQAQRQQKQILTITAHELRNPLTPIQMAAGMLERVSAEELPQMQAIIKHQVAHISRLVDDLLDVARINTGKLRLERQTADMTDILAAAVDACRPAMDTRLQRFGVHVPSCPLNVYGDPIRLAQIFSNLLDNASKYTPDGGEIALSVQVVDDVLVVTVSDSGIGIAAEALPNIFDPFVQETRAIGFNGAGLGIGLTVVRELVEAHGGTVVASSGGKGFGSQFDVTLPLAGRAT